MSEKQHNVSEIDVDPKALLEKGYSAEELIGEKFVIDSFKVLDGEKGTYVSCEISGSEKLVPGRRFVTGANNIVARLERAAEKRLFPLAVTVMKHGRAYDIE